MTKTDKDVDLETLRVWYKGLLDNVVAEMIRVKAVVGTAVEASPVWVSPNEVLIAKVWGIGQKNRFVWVISGEKVITDHIPGRLAKTPQNVARHFSLKWQADADRLVQLAKSKGARGQQLEVVEEYTSKLIKDSEWLYAVSERDDYWQNDLV